MQVISTAVIYKLLSFTLMVSMWSSHLLIISQRLVNSLMNCRSSYCLCVSVSFCLAKAVYSFARIIFDRCLSCVMLSGCIPHFSPFVITLCNTQLSTEDCSFWTAIFPCIVALASCKPLFEF